VLLPPLLTALGDATRLRIVALLGEGPLCVCHIQEILGERQAAVSKHLAVLREAGIVEASVLGKWRIYRLTSRPSSRIRALLRALEKDLREEPCFIRDRKALARLPVGPDGGTAKGCPVPCRRKAGRDLRAKANPRSNRLAPRKAVALSLS
jgi:ArsR family transcriptional regulator, arsenate/arsenite/antimonite-responsive transcriptional repressor